jgi:hydroxymethylpyrimidine kinase/phosphomethylpyrimidine kinase
MYPSRGDQPLIDDPQAAMHALKSHLSLVTPNQHELFLMTGLPTKTHVMAEAAARALARSLDASVLLKGGHVGGDESNDLLFSGDADPIVLHGPRVEGGEDVHGTGCALSSAIAAQLAHGRELLEACQLAKQVVAQMIASPVHPGRGAGAVR